MGLDDALRQRRPGGSDMEQAMKYYHHSQEKITENMLLLTQNLKEQTETANRIIKKDTDVVKRSAEISDINLSSLTKEDGKLHEQSNNAFKYWMWIMIVLVMMVFIGSYFFDLILIKSTSAIYFRHGLTNENSKKKSNCLM